MRDCPLCRSAAVRVREQARPPYRVLECGECGLLFVDPLPEQAILEGVYADSTYYAAWVTDQAVARRRLWARRLRLVRRFKASGRLLDVGCGDGMFLAAAAARGFTVEGTEVSPAAVALTKARTGWTVFRGPVEAAPFGPRSFDLVTLWHVLEHLPRPVEALQAVRRLLRPDGVLLLAVPNAADWLTPLCYRIVRGRPFHYFSPQDKEWHLFHYRPGTLQRLLATTGFRLRWMGPDRAHVTPGKILLDWIAIPLSWRGAEPTWPALAAAATPEV